MSQKEKLESYFKEHIKVKELTWNIVEHEEQIQRVDFFCDDFCFNKDFLDRIYEIFSYRGILTDKPKRRFSFM